MTTLQNIGLTIYFILSLVLFVVAFFMPAIHLTSACVGLSITFLLSIISIED